MSLAVETLYSVDYGYPSQYDTIQAPEFWGFYGMSTPSSSVGERQSPMVIGQYSAASTFTAVPYTSGAHLGVRPLPMYDTYSYYNGTGHGTQISNLTNGNFPYMSGYYWDANRNAFRNYNYYHPNSYSFEFWDPSTSSYREVDISWKLRDEYDVVAHWDADNIHPSETHTYSGYQYYAYDKLPVKTNDLYFTFLDGSSPNRYICDAYLTFTHDSSTNFYSEGYRDQFNPYTSVISKLRAYYPSWSEFTESWNHYAENADEAARAYPIITNIHKNLDDPNKNWVGELSIGVWNKPLWVIGTPDTSSNSRYQIKGCLVTDSVIDPRDVDDEIIYIPRNYGPFGNWLVRLQPISLMSPQTLPIQQRIFTVSKRTDLIFTDNPPGPTIPST